MKQRGISRNITIIAVAVASVLGLVYMAMRSVVPMPDEANRVVNIAGFSIIAPPDWDITSKRAVTAGDTDTISAFPKKAEGNAGEFGVIHTQTPPTEASLLDQRFVKETFDGQPVWVLRTSREKTHEHTIIYGMERGGSWYQIIVRRQATEPIEGPPWSDYVRSLRIEKPTTRPGYPLKDAG